MTNKTRLISSLVAAVLLACHLGAQAAGSAEAIMAASCGGCHSQDDSGRWSRISEQRKTPEGWQMTLVRMQEIHGASIVDPAGGEAGAAMRTLVRHLADTQGLTPAESAPWRYVLERELNTVEQHDSAMFTEMCARCHSGARVGLQRRSEEEWRHLVHFHLGQFPSAEYSLMGRDRDWLGIALSDMVPWLAREFALDSDAWTQWQALPRESFAGRWRVSGHMPGKGLFAGNMVVTDGSDGDYQVELEGAFESGEPLAGAGKALVYSGHEWRASLTLDGEVYQQVLMAEPGSGQLDGRMFRRDNVEWGLRMQAARLDGDARIMAMQPSYIRAGTEQQLLLVGAGLDPEAGIGLGAGLEILAVTDRSVDGMLLQVRAAADAAEGTRAISVGEVGAEGLVTVYHSLDRVAVEPAYAVARVGGNGGSQPVVEAMFDAIGFSDGPDGEAGTADDIRVGPLPAKWSVAPFDAQAAADEDVRFAGAMDADSGVFTPGAAGPNPERKYQTNNAGNLKVLATVAQEDALLDAEGQLIVTVQRWNNPPIR